MDNQTEFVLLCTSSLDGTLHQVDILTRPWLFAACVVLCCCLFCQTALHGCLHWISALLDGSNSHTWGFNHFLHVVISLCVIINQLLWIPGLIFDNNIERFVLLFNYFCIFLLSNLYWPWCYTIKKTSMCEYIRLFLSDWLLGQPGNSLGGVCSI